MNTTTQPFPQLIGMYSVSQKSSPLKLFAVFSLLVNLYNSKLPWLLPNIFLYLHQFWSIYLNICVKCIIFTGESPQILRIQFSLLRNL